MRLPGGAGDVGGDDVGSVPVQAAAGPVVPHCGSRVSVGGGLLHVAQRHASVERGGDERVSERVRADLLADAGVARDLADDPSGAVPVQPPPATGRAPGLGARCQLRWPPRPAGRSARAARSAHALPAARARRLPVAHRARCGRARRRETHSPWLPSSLAKLRCNVEIGQYLGSVAFMHDRGSDQSCPNVLPTPLTSDICRC